MEKSKNTKIKQPIKSGVARVPVVMQMEALECGAAALTMVLAYYGKWIPLEQVREDCGVSRDGSTAGNVARAARTYGLDARGCKLEPEQLKEIPDFPCIIHWDFNHFVVCRGFKKGRFYINDPARGDVVIDEQEFDRHFTGVCILLSPGESFEPSGSPKSMLTFAKRRLKNTGNEMRFVAVTVAITALLGIISSATAVFFMDNLLEGRNEGLMLPFFLFITVFTLMECLATLIRSIYAFRISGKYAALENTSYFWHVLHLPMRFFSQRMAGDIELRRASSAEIANSLVNTFAPLFINMIMLIFYLVIMLKYSVLMTLIGLVSVLFNIFITYKASQKRANVIRVMLNDAAKLSSATVSGIEMIETIKSSGAENGFFRKWAGFQAGVNTQNVAFTLLQVRLGRLPQLIIELTCNLLLVLGAYQVIKGDFTPGMVLGFTGLLTRFFMPSQVLVRAGEQLQELRTEMERIDDVMEYPEDPVFTCNNLKNRSDQSDAESDGETIKEVRKLSGNLTIKNLTFGYSKLAPPLIEGFDLELEKGKIVAFVGGSGCGKSTLSKLISGLYQPWEGEILYDGKPACDIDRDIFTASVAVVDQDIILFEDTIANNIKMWDTSIEDFEMIMAARDARIHEDILQRDGGYSYKLTDGGRDLSGGQRQRLEIARVLAADPTLIIMDEATSALDAQTEYEVVRSIKDRGITCIVIAHRLSTIRDCDEIIVLDKGHVVERGTHDELMKNKGRYLQLVTNE